jgi:hypothetical protein
VTVAVRIDTEPNLCRFCEAQNKLERMPPKSPLAIQDKTGRFLCPVCGHAGTFDGHCFDERGGVIGSGICPCCFYEPGFDDDPMASAKAKAMPLESIKHYRAEWIGEGMPWRSVHAPRPASWNGPRQLADLVRIAPALA